MTGTNADGADTDPSDATVDGPLAGVRVLELGSFIAGPFAGQLLGDYGAEVIKVEPPGDGDPMRRWGVVRDGQSLWWPSIARNKRSVCIDLRAEAGRDLVRRLAAHSDVVLENFRPGRLEEWGLGFDALSTLNPRLVMVHVSGVRPDGTEIPVDGLRERRRGGRRDPLHHGRTRSVAESHRHQPGRCPCCALRSRGRTGCTA